MIFSKYDIFMRKYHDIYQRKYQGVIFLLFIRPPGTTVPDGLMFHPCCFFRQPHLRGPSADRHETLPHDLNLVAIAG